MQLAPVGKEPSGSSNLALATTTASRSTTVTTRVSLSTKLGWARRAPRTGRECTALAAGVDGHIGGGATDTEISCVCREVAPSRQRLTWHCLQQQHASVLRYPEDDGALCLLIPCVEHPADLFERNLLLDAGRVATHLTQVFEQTQTQVILATDGSCIGKTHAQRRAAWSVVVPDCKTVLPLLMHSRAWINQRPPLSFMQSRSLARLLLKLASLCTSSATASLFRSLLVRHGRGINRSPTILPIKQRCVLAKGGSHTHLIPAGLGPRTRLRLGSGQHCTDSTMLGHAAEQT